MESPELYRINAFLFLALLWVLVNLGVLWQLGIRTGADTKVYVNAAYDLLEGDLPNSRLLWYSSYIALLATVFVLGGGLSWVVGIQVFLSGLAAIFFWKAINKLTGDLRISFVAVFVYLAWVKIHQWNIFIYTESFFTSLAIIAFSSWVLARRPWQYGLSILVIAFTFFTRPTGFSFLVGWLVYGLIMIPVRPRLKWSAVLAGLTGGLLLLNLMLEDFVLIESYAKAEIIYPNISLSIESPNDLYFPDNKSTPLTKLLSFTWNNPWYFLKISFIKLFLFFANVKPYFSLLHNLLIILLLYPLYFFAVIGHRRLPADCYEKYFILSFTLAQAFTVALTSENWDGRFLVPILPFIFVLSAVGIIHVLTKKASPDTGRGSNER